MNEETKDVYLLKTIQQDEEQFKEQGTVLGPSDPSDCTYANGYMKRQTVHICLTCKPTGTEILAQGGICTACALECHKDHQVTPIGTRRLFRCDCGNARFPTQPCKLTPVKDVLNDRNAYEGFCSVIDTNSLQCLICEASFPRPQQFTNDTDLKFEAMCTACTRKLPFLAFYRDCILGMVDPDTFIPNKPVDPIKRRPDSNCLLPERYQEGMEHIQGILAWNLRGKLCACPECVEMYQALSVTFLIDDEDSMENYCKAGPKAHENRVETKIGDFDKTLGTLDRYAQGRLAEGTNNLLKGLKRMLSSKTDGTPVTVDDVNKMMTNVHKKRR